MDRRRWPSRRVGAVLVALAWIAVPGWGQPPANTTSCKMLLAQGTVESHRAHFPEAEESFRQAALDEKCRVEAHLGLAETFNGMNRHQDALAAAQVVLDSNPEGDLAVLAYYQLGLAQDRRGRRLNAKKRRAVDAYRKAMDLSDGEHENSVRALMRIYRETRQEDELAALEARFPELRIASRAQQKRRARTTGSTQLDHLASESAATAGSGLAYDCGGGKFIDGFDWQAAMPVFDSYARSGEEAAATGKPLLIENPSPQYTEAARRQRLQGTVRWQIAVDAEGAPGYARILKSLLEDLDVSALQAACRTRWQPLMDAEGTAGPFYVTGHSNFRLQ